MKIVPLGENVVVKRFRPEEKTAGGIVLPDAARKIPQQGRVMSVGDGRICPAERGANAGCRRATASSSARMPASKWSSTASKCSS